MQGNGFKPLYIIHDIGYLLENFSIIITKFEYFKSLEIE